VHGSPSRSRPLGNGCSTSLAGTAFALTTYARPRTGGTSNAVGGLTTSVVPEYPTAPAAYSFNFMSAPAVSTGGDNPQVTLRGRPYDFRSVTLA
jgi:hypothetical protein